MSVSSTPIPSSGDATVADPEIAEAHKALVYELNTTVDEICAWYDKAGAQKEVVSVENSYVETSYDFVSANDRSVEVAPFGFYVIRDENGSVQQVSHYRESCNNAVRYDQLSTAFQMSLFNNRELGGNMVIISGPQNGLRGHVFMDIGSSAWYMFEYEPIEGSDTLQLNKMYGGETCFSSEDSDSGIKPDRWGLIIDPDAPKFTFMEVFRDIYDPRVDRSECRYPVAYRFPVLRVGQGESDLIRETNNPLLMYAQFCAHKISEEQYPNHPDYTIPEDDMPFVVADSILGVPHKVEVKVISTESIDYQYFNGAGKATLVKASVKLEGIGDPVEVSVTAFTEVNTFSRSVTRYAPALFVRALEEHFGDNSEVIEFLSDGKDELFNKIALKNLS
jgi:hypothetical protein